MHEANDVVRGPTNHRVARVRLIDDYPHRLPHGSRRLQERDLGPREHHFPQLPFAGFEDVVDQVPFMLTEFLVSSHEIPQFLAADRLFTRMRIDAEQSNDSVRGHRKRNDEGPEQRSDEVDGPGNEERDFLHALQGDALGNQFTQDQ